MIPELLGMVAGGAVEYIGEGDDRAVGFLSTSCLCEYICEDADT